MGKLTDSKCRSAKPGTLADGGGLYLVTRPTGAKAWYFIQTAENGSRPKRKLGDYPIMSLADAREKLLQLSKAIAGGSTVDDALRPERPAHTFADAAKAYIAAHESSWRNAKHRAQWRATLLGGGRGPDYCATLRSIPIADVGVEHVLAVLAPIWTEKPETASRIRQRVEAVLDAAAVRGWRGDSNPARWKGRLEHLLGKRQKLSRGHHAALPYTELPAFVERLREQAGIAARALEFLILTACRSGEVRGARWGEIDLDARLWTIPADRMKAGREHRVPLSDAAVELLGRMAAMFGSDPDSFVFPGARTGSSLSDMTLAAVLKRMDVPVTVHGFRSSFRDWAGDMTHFPADVAEAALAHAVRDKTEAAYRRGDALDKRRQLMGLWADYVEGETAENVVQLHG